VFSQRKVPLEALFALVKSLQEEIKSLKEARQEIITPPSPPPFALPVADEGTPPPPPPLALPAAAGEPKAHPNKKTITGSTGIIYWVDTEAKTCTCPHYINRKTECKHYRAAVDGLDRVSPVPLFPDEEEEEEAVASATGRPPRSVLWMTEKKTGGDWMGKHGAKFMGQARFQTDGRVWKGNKDHLIVPGAVLVWRAGGGEAFELIGRVTGVKQTEEKGKRGAVQYWVDLDRSTPVNGVKPGEKLPKTKDSKHPRWKNSALERLGLVGKGSLTQGITAVE